MWVIWRYLAQKAAFSGAFRAFQVDLAGPLETLGWWDAAGIETRNPPALCLRI